MGVLIKCSNIWVNIYWILDLKISNMLTDTWNSQQTSSSNFVSVTISHRCS